MISPAEGHRFQETDFRPEIFHGLPQHSAVSAYCSPHARQFTGQCRDEGINFSLSKTLADVIWKTKRPQVFVNIVKPRGNELRLEHQIFPRRASRVIEWVCQLYSRKFFADAIQFQDRLIRKINSLFKASHNVEFEHSADAPYLSRCRIDGIQNLHLTLIVERLVHHGHFGARRRLPAGFVNLRFDAAPSDVCRPHGEQATQHRAGEAEPITERRGNGSGSRHPSYCHNSGGSGDYGKWPKVGSEAGHSPTLPAGLSDVERAAA